MSFPDFMFREENRIPSAQQNAGSFPLRDFGTIGDGSISPVIQEGCSKAKKNYAVC